MVLDFSRKIAICIEHIIKHKYHAYTMYFYIQYTAHTSTIIYYIYMYIYNMHFIAYHAHETYIATITNHYPQLRHDAFSLGKFGHHGRPSVGFAGQSATGDTWGVALGVLTIGEGSVE